MKHLAIPRPIGVRATQYDHRREHQQAGHQEGHRGGDEDRKEERVPGGEAGAIAYATITSLVILAGIVLFVWPEIPNAREDWAYTGPLLGIVVVTLAVGEAIIWRIAHPRSPRLRSSPGEGRVPSLSVTGGGGAES